jgi:hypothetical protein
VDVNFSAAAQLLAFGVTVNDLEAKDNSMEISLSGVGQEFISVVLGNPIQGSKIYLTRGFYSEQNGELVDVPYERWAGRINSFSIKDDFQFGDGDKIVISISCTSLLNTLLERVAGRYTNKASQEKYYDGTHPGNHEGGPDRSMEFVADLVNFNPNFGKGQWFDSGGGGGGKVVCTAMNAEYGFGSFRNAIWLNYAKENLTPYHEKGYHKIFGPWVARMYLDTWWSPYLAKWGEGVARRRSADIWAVMKGKKKRSWLARTERAIMEPLAYIVGRWFSK